MRLITPKSIDLSRRKLLVGAAALAAYEGLSLDLCEQAAAACGVFGATPPPQAVAAGMTNLVFADDFTSTTTFATDEFQNYTPGVNWYAGFQGGQTTNVQPTLTAAQVSNDNTSGGPNASPYGGVVSLLMPAGQRFNCWISVSGWQMNTAGAVQPPAGQGNWGHSYIEQYTQFNINNAATTNPATWPSFWSWQLEAIGNFGFGSSSLTSAFPIERDFFESDGPNFSDFLGVCTSNIANHGTGNVVQFAKGYPTTVSGGVTYPAVNPYWDCEWHTVGSLWAPDPAHTGQGLASFWFDNVQYGNAVSTGGSGSAFPAEGQHFFLIINGAAGSPSYIDWVRVWQAP